MTTEEEALKEGVRAHPEDLARWDVLADWYAERGREDDERVCRTRVDRLALALVEVDNRHVTELRVRVFEAAPAPRVGHLILEPRPIWEIPFAAGRSSSFELAMTPAWSLTARLPVTVEFAFYSTRHARYSMRADRFVPVGEVRLGGPWGWEMTRLVLPSPTWPGPLYPRPPVTVVRDFSTVCLISHRPRPPGRPVDSHPS